MYREIKFRVWDSAATGRMSEIFTLSHALGVEFSNPLDTLPLMFVAVRNDRFTFMQFTGLKDSLGMEIFEGDIVEMLHWEPSRWLVDYSNETGAFYFRHKVEQPYDTCHPMRYLEKAAVIGNVYEHPELLESPATGSTTTEKP